MITTRKIILPLRTKIRTGKYGVIYIPKAYRDLFPPYKIIFIIQTGDNSIHPWVTGKNKANPEGCNIIGGGLLDWFREQSLSSEDSLVIEIIKPYKIYRLTILNGYEDFIEESKKEDIISLSEGGERIVISRRAERNPKLRAFAIKFHGLICKVCGFNFQKTYGKWGEGFIEVHHISPLGKPSKISVQTDPRKDLTVLCSNCHKMIHRVRGVTLTLQELKAKLNSSL